MPETNLDELVARLKAPEKYPFQGMMRADMREAAEIIERQQRQLATREATLQAFVEMLSEDEDMRDYAQTILDKLVASALSYVAGHVGHQSGTYARMEKVFESTAGEWAKVRQQEFDALDPGVQHILTELRKATATLKEAVDAE